MKRVALALLALTMSLITTLTFAATEETVRKGGFNSVILYTPTTLSPVGNGRSLMVVLHGCTQPTLNFKTANLDKAADEHGMVIAVPDAVYKEGFQCWGYWTGMPSRTYNDYKNILNLVSELLSDATYNIDPNQVYIAGLSSGGAFAMETGCLAPDVFAGMGLVGAPSAGTGAMGAFSHEGTVASVKSNCNSTAGSNASHFNTQVTVSAYGTSDTTVPQSYGPQNAKAMAGVYGHSEPSEVTTMTGAKITTNTENTVALVELTGEGHTWPGGTGASGSFIGNKTINYASYLGEWFAQNNRRLTDSGDGDGDTDGDGDGDNNELPTVSLNVSVSGVSAIATGTAADSDGTIASTKISIAGVGNDYSAGPVTLTLNASGQFSYSFDELSNGQYEVTVEVTDDKGAKATQKKSAEIVAGPDTSCPSVTGTVEELESDTALIETYSSFGLTLYRTTGDQTTVYKSGGQSYTIFIGNDGKGYIEDPNNCEDDEVVQYTVSATATAGGTVTPSIQTIESGQVASVVVTPNTGYEINEVSGCGGSLMTEGGSGTEYRTAAITADCSITASFKQATVDPTYYTVTATAGSGGRVSPGTQSVEAGKTGSVTVTANDGYVIDAVSGCGGALSGTTFTTGAVAANCTITASFRLSSVPPVNYTVTASAGTGGSVSPATQQVQSGNTAVVTIAPDAGYRIGAVSGTCGGTLSGTTYTTTAVSQNCTVSVSFQEEGDVPVQYTVSTNAGANGFISPSAQQVVAAGTALVFTITPDNGYEIAAVQGCGGVWDPSASVNNFTIASVGSNCTVYATFTASNTGNDGDDDGDADGDDDGDDSISVDGGALPPVFLLMVTLPLLLLRRRQS